MSLSSFAETERRIGNSVRYLVGSGAPVNGVAGTGVSEGAGPGSTYTDIINKFLYFQNGALGNPVWTQVTTILANGSVTTAILADGAVTTIKLADGNVTTAKIAGGAIGSTQIANGAIGDAQCGVGAINGNKLVASSVTGSQIANTTIATGNIIDSAVTSAKIAAGAVGFPQLSGQVIAQTVTNISSADITGTGAGQLSSAGGVPISIVPGANNYVELISCLISYHFLTANYNNAGGGNMRVSMSGVAQSPNISVVGFTAGPSNPVIANSLFSAAWTGIVPNLSLNLISTTVFTNPGTAAGTFTIYCNYRIYFNP
jgi:hypothetical protein